MKPAPETADNSKVVDWVAIVAHPHPGCDQHEVTSWPREGFVVRKTISIILDTGTQLWMA
jgi:hypothetical protein